MQSARDFAIQKFAKDLVESIDNLDRALSTVPQEKLTPDESSPAKKDLINLYDGLKMTEAILMQTLKKHGLERFDPSVEGEPFNPNLHEATFQAPMEGKEQGTVFQTQQKGFTLNGRVLRVSAMTTLPILAPIANSNIGGKGGHCKKLLKQQNIFHTCIGFCKVSEAILPSVHIILLSLENALQGAWVRNIVEIQTKDIRVFAYDHGCSLWIFLLFSCDDRYGLLSNPFVASGSQSRLESHHDKHLCTKEEGTIQLIDRPKGDSYRLPMGTRL